MGFIPRKDARRIRVMAFSDLRLSWIILHKTAPNPHNVINE
jgi:hypothetical protein